MVVADGLVTHALALLSCLGSPCARCMVGGHGLAVDSHFVALILGDVLYLKADALARPAFEASGCRPSGYATQTGQRAVLGYRSALDDAMESPGLMLPWARLAMASALRAAAAKRLAAAPKPRAAARQTPPRPRAKP